MDHLSFPVEWKAGANGSGELTGYMSVFGNVDLGGDVVLPGAFKKTFADWSRAKTPMPLIADHELSTEGVIGSVKSMVEDARGAKVSAAFASTQKAQDVRTLILEGHVNGMSFTYQPVGFHFGQVGDQKVRYLSELKVFEATVTPFPMNTLATASAKASDRPWSDFSAADYTPAQWAAACIIDTGQGDPTSKDRYKLPVKEPGGALNRNGVHAAAARLNQVSGISPAERTTAARALVRYYGQLGEDPPESLRQMAGQHSLDFDSWCETMTKALSVPDLSLRRAFVDLTIGAYKTEPAAPPDGESTGEPAATTDGKSADGTGQKDDPAVYGLAFIKHPEPLDGALNPVAALEAARSDAELDRLEAQLKSALGGSNA